MKKNARRLVTGFFVCLSVLVVCLLGPLPQYVFAQTEEASVSGRITDQTNAVVPDAIVEIRNTDTGIVSSTKTNDQGVYAFPSLPPGNYIMNVHKQGFRSVSVTEVKLYVQDNISRNFTLQVGSSAESVTVVAESGAGLVNVTGSEIGTVVEETEVHDLPLNGRNFTQLLTLVPGVTPISTAQWTGVGNVLSVPSSVVAAPAIGGQWNRSTLYMADGVLNNDMNLNTYTVPIVVDAIQEFKVQAHNDGAEFGGVLGGVVNLVTRSGTNSVHGSAWEFVRNNVFDARDPFRDEFRSSPSPFRQNEFGGTFGGPVVIPKLYNGRNRTFFFFAYEGWRYRQAAQNRYVVPTAAELSGDFSSSILNQNIYDPATTQPDPSNPGQFTRAQFVASSNSSSPNFNSACMNAAGCPNMIPSSRIDQKIVNFLSTYYGSPNLSGDPVHNAIVTRSNISDSNQYNVRIDEQLGNKDSLFFGYSQLGVRQDNALTVLETTGGFETGRLIRAGWNHVFTPTLMLETRGGYNDRNRLGYAAKNSRGLAPMLGLGFPSAGGSLLQFASPWGSVGMENSTTHSSPLYQISASLTWVHGRHDLKFGGQYIHHGTDQTFPTHGEFQFTNDTTANPEQAGTTGSSLASALLGLPSQTNIFPLFIALTDRVPVWAGFAQDKWKMGNNVTLTFGLRFDHRGAFSPGRGLFDAGPVPNGDYWIGLNQMPGLCSDVGKAPCLPAPLSQIPFGDHIKLSPYGTAFGPKPEWDEWGPRVGVAWRVTPNTVVRGGYGITYDPLTGINQDWKGILGSWPAAAGGWSLKNWNQLGQPQTSIEQTFGAASTPLPAPTPWTQTNWFFDPARQDARSQQWNLEIQRQVTNNLALSIGYLGSYSDRLDETGLWNTARTPGPGTPAEVNALRPAPWWGSTNFLGTSTGNANYNALEVKLERRFAQGLYGLVSYTWSKTIDIGSSGWFAAENGTASGQLQDYYNPNGSRSVSSYDIPHFLSMTGIYELPFGKGKKYFDHHGAASWILGNWQVNSVVQTRSGQPFTVFVNGDVANIGNTVSWWSYARPNLVGNPHVSNPTAAQWFNPSAFAVPSFSYGNSGRNTLRSAPVYFADFSLFKKFPVREGMNLEFRGEIFNLFNIQNLGVPDSGVGDPAEGRVSSTVTNPRQIQLAFKLAF
jgi:Carboxypeptidase regulatory-like domain/TonB dependent receptor